MESKEWIPTYLPRYIRFIFTTASTYIKAGLRLLWRIMVYESSSSQLIRTEEERTPIQSPLTLVVSKKTKSTVDNDTQNGRTETTVETDNTVGGESLSVDINSTIKLTITTTLGRLGIIGETGTRRRAGK